MSQAAYRVRQFFSSLLARVSEQDLHDADAHLPPGAHKLFRRMPAADQRHALAVMRSLKQTRPADQDSSALLQAALLHDVGKSAAWLTPVHRAVIVLAQRFWPAAWDWLAREPAPKWRQPFGIHRRHPELGAQWAEQAGCDAVSVTLIRRHQEPINIRPQNEIERLLVELQRADKKY